METEIKEEEKIEEEASSLSQILVSPKNYSWIKDETLVIVERVDKTSYSNKASSLDICGKTMLDWVLMPLSIYDCKVIDEMSDESLLELLKLIETDKKFIFFTYSDIPFLEKKTFNEIMDYFSTHNLNALAFQRGFILRTDYIRSLKDLNFSCKKFFGEKDFTRIDDAISLSYAYTFFSDKIKNYHKNNNVILFGENSIFIDADVEIEGGTIIYPNNVLKGQTYIGKNVVLQSGNIISDSIISDDCVIEKSIIIKSKITEGKTISAFSKFENESV